MSTENYVLREKALDSLKGKWGIAIGTFFIYGLIVGGLGLIPIVGSLASLIITGPFMVGLCLFSFSISRNGDTRLELIFDGFKNFGNALGAYLLMVLFILLWTLLLIIPGIIAALSYSMTFYIMADDSSIGSMQAIDKSKKMMNGYKGKYFLMQLSFIGWALLCLLTVGIGFLWLFHTYKSAMPNFTTT